MFSHLSSCILLINSCPNRSSSPFQIWDVPLRPLCHGQQLDVAFFLKNLCPLKQCFRIGFDRIARCLESGSGKETFTGALVVWAGSHLDLKT
jgi:hypothetical protein